MKKLPIGIQTFEKIRNQDCIYIDKTEMIHRLVQLDGASYFLSRPRRFGKSLLVDTFKSLFEGHKSLFEGLFIYDKWDWEKTYPVIQLSFADGVIQSRADLDTRIKDIFYEAQEQLGVECRTDTDIPGCFRELIQKASAKYGTKVVVLVDEYDKPILDNIENPEVAAEVREGLKNVYSVLKGQDAYLQFVFMTGVTKFSKVSLFSGMNQLNDITLDANYSTLCGYTQNDLETSFAEHLQTVDWDKLKTWYNGYHFLGEAVYNPFDILLFISKGCVYRSYWFETGSPSFLLKLFKQKQYFLPELDSMEVSEDILESFEIDNIDPVTLLFQAGYLTIAQMNESDFAGVTFELKVPNQEVRNALANQVVDAYTYFEKRDRLPRQMQLAKNLSQGDLAAFQAHITSVFAGIPWRNFTASEVYGTPLYESEGYYASVLYAFLASINATIIPEDISNRGQADMTVILGDYVYVMEIKRDTSKQYDAAQPNPALAQILERNYAEKYRHLAQEGKQIIQLGLVFNTTERNLVALDSQSL